MAIAAWLSLSGCSVLGDVYDGDYSVHCSFTDDEEIRSEMFRVANALSGHFGQPISVRRNAPDGLIIDILISAQEPSAQTSRASLTVQRQTLRGNSDYVVGVSKMGPAPNAVTNDAQALIQVILRNSRCAEWNFHVSHGSFAH